MVAELWPTVENGVVKAACLHCEKRARTTKERLCDSCWSQVRIAAGTPGRSFTLTRRSSELHISTRPSWSKQTPESWPSLIPRTIMKLPRRCAIAVLDRVVVQTREYLAARVPPVKCQASLISFWRKVRARTGSSLDLWELFFRRTESNRCHGGTRCFEKSVAVRHSCA
jgi:hypothetical protein